ncbi:recombinase family protein [Serratia nevei]|uniref:recombinase family protein n=1 Tax=Serratia nevei TaxID=2703794 RepID=UPI003FA7B215
MLIGYARVSTDDQHLDTQRDALTLAGCERIFEDRGSGAQAEREGLANLITSLRPANTVVIWRQDRLGRSLKNLLQLVEGCSALVWRLKVFYVRMPCLKDSSLSS